MSCFSEDLLRITWYAIKKNAVQSYSEAAKAGAVKQKLKQEWSRMDAMDVSDVYYNALLANGKLEDTAPQFKAGDKIRLRLINGSASTYFWVQFAGGKMSVAASDGIDVVPVEVDRMLIAVAETFNIENFILVGPGNINFPGEKQIV